MRKGDPMNDDELIAYLAGEATTPGDPAKRAELDKLRGLLSDEAVWIEPRADMQEGIVGAIARAGANSSDSGEDQESTAPTDGRENVVELRSRWRRYAILGAAAAVLFVVGLTIGLTNDGNESIDFEASLEGTHLAPDASGQVTMTRTASGWKIHLQAQGLPRLDNGAYYEAWLKNDDGVLVPTGTFNQPDDVILWAGVPPSSYPTLSVTRQLANGNPASSGQVVLVGASHPND
jgi:hypothetical protein